MLRSDAGTRRGNTSGGGLRVVTRHFMTSPGAKMQFFERSERVFQTRRTESCITRRPCLLSTNVAWTFRCPPPPPAIMALRPTTFRAADTAVRDPRGGALDPAVVAEAMPAQAAGVTKPPPSPASVGLPAAPSGPACNWVLGSSVAMRRIAKSIQRAAEVECTVLVSGETGTGKELWARLLHRSGPRSDRAFVPINCGALTSSLAESQLFGHEKGAFTGAQGKTLGIFRAAEGGIVFLDEIGEMPLELQPKLLRVLQQREVMPVGSSEPESIDVQIVAATNRDLEAEVEKGTFREDLYYRLNMIELRIPPLRDRPEDIPAFIEFFSRKFADRYRMPAWEPSAAALAEFCAFGWPGNVRQLEHVIEQAYVLQMEPCLPVSASKRSPGSSDRLPCLDLTKLRERAIRQALEVTRGHKARAAKLLGVHANTMTRLLKEIEEGKADASGDEPDAD
jgi:two-component system response regulator PilR (NtrC family)